MRAAFTLLGVLLLGSTTVMAAQASPALTKPEAKSRVAPDFPQDMLAQDREGWVDIRFSVAPDGSVADAEVIEASNGRFEKPALSAMKRWTFSPGLMDGKPVAVRNQTMRMHFLIRGTGGKFVSSAAVRNDIRDAHVALEENRLDEAKARIDEIYGQARTMNDYAYLFALHARWHAAKGNVNEMLRLLARSASDPKFVNKEFQRDRLHEIFRLEAKLGLYGDAVRTYKRIQDLGDAPPPAFTKAVADMERLAASGEPMSIVLPVAEPCPAELACAGEQGRARYRPMRRTLVLDGAAPLERAEARCELATAALPVAAGAVWSLQPDWGDCTVEMYGAKGTVVTLVER